MKTIYPREDLHVHTCYSDGQYAPEKVIQMAIANDIKTIAITDHNRMVDQEEMAYLQEKYKDQIEIIPGVEISATYVTADEKISEIHIVGLNPNSRINNFLATYEPDRKGYIEAFRKAFLPFGYHLPTYEEFQELFPESEHIGRKHIAIWLNEHEDSIESVDYVFDKYIGAFGEKLAFVNSKDYNNYSDISVVIQALIDADATAIVAAHLPLYRFDVKEEIRFLKYFKLFAGPLSALEVYYRKYDEDTRLRMKTLADMYGFLHSSGSDYHGFSETDSIDNDFTYGCWRRMKRNKERLRLKQEI